MAAFMFCHLDARACALALLAVVLVTAGLADWRTGKIPNALTYPAFLVAVLFQALAAGPNWAEALGQAGLGFLTAFVPMWLGWKAGGIRMGDAKLMAVIGTLGGWRFALSTMFWGFAVAALMAAIVMIRKRIVKQTLARIGRFLWIAAGGHKPVDPTTPDSPTIPLGLALCIGAAWTVVGELTGLNLTPGLPPL